MPAGRGRTCSRKLYFGRYISCGCHDPFADKSAPWPSARIQSRLAYNDKMVAFRLMPAGRANLFAKALFRAIHLLRMSRPFRGQVRSYGLRPESKAGLRITIKWWRSGLCPQGVGANLFAKALFRAIHLLRMSRPFRGQVRSYGLRPESKAGLRITIKWWRSGLCPQGVGANLFAKALFRAIHLLRMSRPFRGQVRSYGLRPESKAGLRITIKWWRSGLCPQGVRTCSRKLYFGRYISCGCHGPFADKSAPTAFGQNPKQACV